MRAEEKPVLVASDGLNLHKGAKTAESDDFVMAQTLKSLIGTLLLSLSTIAGTEISNPSWVNFQSAGWVSFQSAPTPQDFYLDF